MTVEVMPVGTRCPLACRMCFQNTIRKAGNQSGGKYDLDAMKKGLEAENYHFTLFGGEALLMPVEDLEELWRWGLEKFGSNGIQTSGSCVTEKHFELFEKYKVSVGISMEGPGELNDIRWAGSIEKTREASKRSEGVLRRLLEEGRSPSLITTLSQSNASREKLPRLLQWFRELGELGLKGVNLHLLEVDDPKVRNQWALTPEQNAVALLACGDLAAELDMEFRPLSDFTGLLLGDDGRSNCTWNACDPYTTRAVAGIGPDGGRVNCSRSAKAGVDMPKADTELLVRPIALFHTAQAAGGCAGCRFWFACKGSCPGEAIDGDWRNKSEHCEALKILFGATEARLRRVGLKPISSDHPRRRKVEARLLDAFRAHQTMRVCEALKDKPKPAKKAADGTHGDVPHGDSDHGDSHGDVPHGDSDIAGGKS